MTLTLAVVNDYEVVVRGVFQMLQPFGSRVRVVELDLRLGVEAPVDIALYDTFAQGRELSTELDDLLTQRRVGRLVLYTLCRPKIRNSTLPVGVSGMVSKSLPAVELVDALERVYAGEQVVRLGADRRDGMSQWPGNGGGLTAREAEVMALIAQGLSNVQIADRANLSINSVKSYIRNAYRKVASRTAPRRCCGGSSTGCGRTVAASVPDVSDDPDRQRRP